MEKFIDEVVATPGGENVLACIQCGVCSGSCPMADSMEYPPRKIIAMIRADMREEVLKSSSMWYCLSCYTCTVRCPQDVKPTELAHALEGLAVKYGYKSKETAVPAMYGKFVDSIKRYGRVHELGMMVEFYISITPRLLRHPIDTLKMMPVALSLLRHKRLSVMPTKIKDAGNLPEIIKKFNEIRGEA